MKKIILLFRFLKNKIIIWYDYYIRQTRTTEKGLYASYYFIDKYLLKTNEDNYVQEYEEILDLTCRRIQNRARFVDASLEEIRECAAFFTIINFTIMSSKEMKKKITDYLKDWKYFSVFETYVKIGAFL